MTTKITFSTVLLGLFLLETGSTCAQLKKNSPQATRDLPATVQAQQEYKLLTSQSNLATPASEQHAVLQARFAQTLKSNSTQDEKNAESKKETKWFFIIGGAVVAGTAAAILLTRKGDSNKEGLTFPGFPEEIE